jgi:hypothetical protein
MSADFVPFLQAINSRFAAHTPPSEFAPLPANKDASAPAPVRHGEVKVELKRDGDRISQIRIYCRCGELIELNCDYGASGGP